MSVFYGKPFAEGPGAVVTSYNPQLRWADADPERGAVMRGPFALVRPIALMFKEAYAQQTGLTVAEATELLKAPEHSVLRDAVIQCDKMLVPALELVIRISSVSVFVSADLLTHPAALAWWRCKAKSPVLDRLVI